MREFSRIILIMMPIVKPKWHKEFSSPVINAGKGWHPSISSAEREAYGPFKRLIVENRNSTITFEMRLNTTVQGDDTFVDAGLYATHLLVQSGLEIEPKDGITYDFIAILNTHASSNSTAGDIKIRIQNY